MRIASQRCRDEEREKEEEIQKTEWFCILYVTN